MRAMASKVEFGSIGGNASSELDVGQIALLARQRIYLKLELARHETSFGYAGWTP